MKLTFAGHSTFIVEQNGHRVIIDPFLSGNPAAVHKPLDLHVEAVLLSHGHGDHTLDAEAIARANDCVIVAPNELANYFGAKGLKAHPMGIGGSRQFEFGRVKFTQAFHSSSVESESGPIYTGMPAGILLTMDGITIYHAGDTGLFGDMKIIGEMAKPDVALLPIGDNFTMGPDDALVAAQWLGAKHVVPMHYDTFGLIAQDAELFVNKVNALGLQGVVLKIGESLDL